MAHGGWYGESRKHAEAVHKGRIRKYGYKRWLHSKKR
jgi:hypothetical protein